MLPVIAGLTRNLPNRALPVTRDRQIAGQARNDSLD